MSELTLCADDFGLNRSVNAGIIELVAAGRLTAVSCMTVASCFRSDAAELMCAVASAPGPVDVGLHMTLTEYQPLTAMRKFAAGGRLPSIGSAIAKSYSGRIDRIEIEDELNRQWQAFNSAIGRLPDFLDGHQHVHVLPLIRDVVVSRACLGLAEGGWVRSCYAPPAMIVSTGRSVGRALFICALSRKLKHMLAERRVLTNDLFLGINAFRSNDHYGDSMRAWLKVASAAQNAKVLMMCHPAHAVQNPDQGLEQTPGHEPEQLIDNDPIAQRRPDEFEYLSSQVFLDDLNASGCSLRALR